MVQQIFQLYKTSFSGLNRNTWLLGIVLLINRSGYMAVPFMGLYLTQSLNRSAADAGLIISLFGLGAMAGSAVGGKLTDVIGFKAVQVIASIVSGVFFLLFAYVEDFNILCVLSVVISFFSEAFRPANYAAVSAYSDPKNLTRSFSLNRLATNLGWAFGVSIGGFIASIDYKLLFIVDGAVTILVGIVIQFALPAIRSKKPVEESADTVLNIQKPWKDIIFIKFILLTTIFAICFFLMFRVVPIFFKEEWHIDEFEIGILLGLNGVIIALFEMIMITYIEKRRTPVFYIIVGTIGVGIAFILLILPPTLPIILALASIICFTIGEMFALPFINNFVFTRSNEYNRGQYAGGYTLSWSIASVVGPATGFYIAETAGYNTLWLLLGVCVLLVAFGYKLLGMHIKRV